MLKWVPSKCDSLYLLSYTNDVTSVCGHASECLLMVYTCQISPVTVFVYNAQRAAQDFVSLRFLVWKKASENFRPLQSCQFVSVFPIKIEQWHRYTINIVYL